MVIVLNGPLGVGKTETAWRLIQLLSHAAMVDIDYVAALHPFDYRLARDLNYAYESAAVLADHHVRNGYEDVVVNWVFETQAQLDALRRLFSRFGTVRAYVLTCSIEELERRIHRRGGANIERDLARGRELHAILEKASKAGDIGTPIDTESRTAQQMATAILDLAV